MVHREATQLTAAGDDDQRTGAGRQDSELAGVTGVVEHQQHPPPADQRPEPCGPFLDRFRQGFRIRTQRAQESLEHEPQVGRAISRMATQIDEQLPVRELVAMTIRPVQCQRRLAGAGRSADQRDRRSRRLPGGDEIELVQLSQFGVPADQLADARRELFGYREVDHRRRAQQRGVQRAQLRPGIGAQLVRQHAADPLVLGECLRRPSATFQRCDQPGPQRFTQPVVLGQLAQLADEFRLPARGQIEVDPAFGRGQVLLHQARCFPLVQPRRVHLGERGASPQRQRRAEQPAFLLGVLRIRRGSEQPVEPMGVDGIGSQLQRVAAGPGDDQVHPDQVPQPGDQGLARAAGSPRRPPPVVAPVAQSAQKPVHRPRGGRAPPRGRTSVGPDEPVRRAGRGPSRDSSVRRRLVGRADRRHRAAVALRRPADQRDAVVVLGQCGAAPADGGRPGVLRAPRGPGPGVPETLAASGRISRRGRRREVRVGRPARRSAADRAPAGGEHAGR